MVKYKKEGDKMKFTISSSSNDLIDEKYKISAQHLLDYLVTIPNAELNWGSCSISIMGLCYDTFLKAGKPIHGYTSSKYADDIKMYYSPGANDDVRF